VRAPYAVDDNKIYVRDEAETGLAVRDEIVGLVRRGQIQHPEIKMEAKVVETPVEKPVVETQSESPPRTGVEIVEVEERDGSHYYTMRDLRNGNVVKNVTRGSARKLWHYAIKEHARLPQDANKLQVQWNGDVGLLGQQRQGKFHRYDLIQRTSQGYRYYFGVTDDGIHGRWKVLVGAEDE
jgi:hypothetical protein